MKVLCPTDFSTDAKNALYYTINLCSALNAEIILFHSYKCPETVSEIPFEELCDTMEMDYKNQMKELIGEGNTINPNLAFRYILREGHFTESITDIVNAEGIDLVVMGTKGAGALKALLFDTHAAKVIERVKCPVLVVPDGYTFQPLSNILFSCDYYDSDINNLEYLTRLASVFDASVTVANIASDDSLIQGIITREFEKDVRKRIRYPRISFVCLEGKDIYETITSYTSKKNSSLLVMSTRHRNKFEKIFDHSLTKKIAYHTSIPLLAFHVQKAAD